MRSQTGRPGRVWLDETPHSSLVVPKADADIVKSIEEGSLHLVTANVENVARSSKTGRALFASVLKQVAHMTLMETVKKWLANLTGSEMNSAKIATSLASTEQEVHGIEGIDELEEKRQYVLQYRGAEIVIVLKSPVLLPEKMLRMCLRENGALNGNITALPGEEALWTEPSTPKLKFAKCEYKQADRARKTLVTTVTELARADGREPSGDDVKDILPQKTATLP
eukprot:736325-Amphidinium_carterae.3